MILQALKQRAKSSLITPRDFPLYIKPLQQKKETKDVIYLDDIHSYTNKFTGKRIKGVTTFIGNLTPKVESYPTESTQLRLGLTKEEVCLYWKQKNRWAIGRGSFVHNLIEYELSLQDIRYLYTDITVIGKELKEDFFVYLEFAKSRVKGKKYLVEALLYHLGLNIAGQADLIVEDKDGFYIEDWKTNDKDLEEDDSFNKELLPNFLATTLNKYILQLNIYAYLYSIMSNKKCKGIHIHHFRESRVKTFSYDYNPLLIEQLWQPIK